MFASIKSLGRKQYTDNRREALSRDTVYVSTLLDSRHRQLKWLKSKHTLFLSLGRPSWHEA